jgi:hypothetical protein
VSIHLLGLLFFVPPPPVEADAATRGCHGRRLTGLPIPAPSPAVPNRHTVVAALGLSIPVPSLYLTAHGRRRPRPPAPSPSLCRSPYPRAWFRSVPVFGYWFIMDWRSIRFWPWIVLFPIFHASVLYFCVCLCSLYEFTWIKLLNLLLVIDLYELANLILPPFQNIRCFSFVKQMYLDIF